MTKIVKSLAVIAFVAAIAVGATSSFFSDTETSTGNTFTAGAIDLKIDNECYLNGKPVEECTWKLTDLTDELFFNFADLKPGDWGEDTVSVHVYNNDAWACVTLKNLVSADNTCTEPESAVDPDGPTCLPNGELDDALYFVFWADVGTSTQEPSCYKAEPGDNLYQPICGDKLLMEGPASYLVGTTTTYALADSDENNVGGTVGEPLTGTDIYYIGKAWCFGAIAIDPLTGAVTCDGVNVNNASQSDSLTGDVEFYAEQSRNNGDFQCVD